MDCVSIMYLKYCDIADEKAKYIRISCVSFESDFCFFLRKSNLNNQHYIPFFRNQQMRFLEFQQQQKHQFPKIFIDSLVILSKKKTK